jgi:hypothetical protein
MKLTRIIKNKMSGDDVRFLQTKLKEHGFYNGPISGYYSQDTLISITNFQRKLNIKPDGVITNITWSNLINYKKQIIADKDNFKYNLSLVTNNNLKIYDSNISDNNYFYIEETPKLNIWLKGSNSIYLHETQTWDKYVKSDVIYKSSPTYTICGYNENDNIWDGKVIRNYDDKYWSYHSPYTNLTKKLNMSSVSIEIKNYGQLIKIDNKFYTRTGLIINDNEVYNIEDKYWHKYSDKQIESLGKLIEYLISKWEIKKSNIDFNFNKDAKGVIIENLIQQDNLKNILI